MAINGFKKLSEEAPKHSWVETGTAVFAFFNIVVLSICAATCIGFLGCMIISQWLVYGEDPDQVFLWYLCLVLWVATSIAFVFGVLLYLGMYQKRSSFVLAYFIFGVATLIFVVSAVYSLDNMHINIRNSVRNIFNDYYRMILGVCVVYSLVLGMICHTYILMRSRRLDQKRLANDGDQIKVIEDIVSNTTKENIASYRPEGF